MSDEPCSACGGRGYIGGEPGKGSWETLCPICLDESLPVADDNSEVARLVKALADAQEKK